MNHCFVLFLQTDHSLRVKNAALLRKVHGLIIPLIFMSYAKTLKDADSSSLSPSFGPLQEKVKTSPKYDINKEFYTQLRRRLPATHSPGGGCWLHTAQEKATV